MPLTLPFTDLPCACKFCVRARKFQRLTEDLSAADQQWMDNLYNALVDLELELELRTTADPHPAKHKEPASSPHP